MKKFFIFALVLFSFLPIITVFSSNDLASRLSGRILLQVEENGEAWYVNPDGLDIYYLGRPVDAFNLMKELGLGISNQDLAKLSIGVSDFVQNDSDGDGLDDALENVIGTDKDNNDSDSDGYDDKSEVLNNFNPNGLGEMDIDEELGERLAGRILLQVEENGEAWYVNPDDLKRYYLGKPTDAFNLMRQFGLGISNQDLEEIMKLEEEDEDEATCDSCYLSSLSSFQVKQAVVNAIRDNNPTELKKYYVEDKEETAENIINSLDEEGRDIWADFISEAKLIESGDDEYVYQTTIEFAGSEVEINYTIIKQDGQWLFDSL